MEISAAKQRTRPSGLSVINSRKVSAQSVVKKKLRTPASLVEVTSGTGFLSGGTNLGPI